MVSPLERRILELTATDSELGWLVGFINGEGCFLIAPNNTGYACAFMVNLRADDRHALKMARRISGNLGTITTSRPANKRLNPVAKWQVWRRDDCRALANLLLGNGVATLSGAKAYQFLTWYEALLEWSTVARPPRRGCAHDWSRMAELHDRLKALRAFGSTPDLALTDKAPKEATT